MVNFYHRKIMIPPRKTKTLATYAPPPLPPSATLKLRYGRQESLISVPDKRKSCFYSRPRNDLPAQQVSRHIVLTAHNHPVPKVKKQWSCTFRRRPMLVAGCSNDTIYRNVCVPRTCISARPGHLFWVGQFQGRQTCVD